ncbi:hypothetical protein FF1_024665 [Malus domestica]
MPPEFWANPSLLPFHPANILCYSRMTYLPMSYLFGKNFVGPITPLILQLRAELYNEPYSEIRWSKIRHRAQKITTFPMVKHIHYEDENTRNITIGDVEKPLNMLACWVEDPNGESNKKHIARLEDYIWVAEDGMKMLEQG